MNKETLKMIRKAAFAVSFGLTMGKFAGDIISSLSIGAVQGITKVMAEEGNRSAQEVCKRANIKYNDSKENKNESKAKIIGFQCR